MEALKDWALAVCVAAVAGSIAHLVAPAGAMQKVLKLTISLLFLCAMFAPVLTGALRGEWNITTPTPDLPTQQLEDLQQEMQTQVETQFAVSVEQLVQQVLAEIAVTPENIIVNVHTDAENRISIKEIVLTLRTEDQNKQADVCRQVEEKLGKRPVVELRAGGSNDGL